MWFKRAYKKHLFINDSVKSFAQFSGLWNWSNREGGGGGGRDGGGVNVRTEGHTFIGNSSSLSRVPLVK